MKNTFRKLFATATLAITGLVLTASAAKAQDKLVYDQSVNAVIGITIENANGAQYKIVDEHGKTVYKGHVKGDNTFYVPVKDLGKGNFKFMLGNTAIQQFEVK